MKIDLQQSSDDLCLGKHTFGGLKHLHLDRLLGWNITSSDENRLVATIDGGQFNNAVGTIFLGVHRDFGKLGGMFVCAILAVLSSTIFRLSTRSSGKGESCPVCPAVYGSHVLGIQLSFLDVGSRPFEVDARVLRELGFGRVQKTPGWLALTQNECCKSTCHPRKEDQPRVKEMEFMFEERVTLTFGSWNCKRLRWTCELPNRRSQYDE